MKEVEAAGGSVVLASQQVGEMGIYGLFKDTEGNLIGMWESLGE